MSIRVSGEKLMTTRKIRNQDELGADAAGQSGDTQQVSDEAAADSQSVEELAEEGNAADAVQGVEDAKDPDVSEVTTREVPEDDVPGEYLDDDEHIA
jgi:hypothetical protein